VTFQPHYDIFLTSDWIKTKKSKKAKKKILKNFEKIFLTGKNILN